MLTNNFLSQGPYEIFVRELVAVDGQDQSEILLIDSNGCPTDAAIMGAMNKIGGDKKAIEGPFDAFKFPTSETVQFRALVTPCLPTCEPVRCNVRSFDGSSREMDSLGRRRRRRSISSDDSSSNEEEILVAKAIQIKDKFAFNGKDKQKGGQRFAPHDSNREEGKKLAMSHPYHLHQPQGVCPFLCWTPAIRGSQCAHLIESLQSALHANPHLHLDDSLQK